MRPRVKSYGLSSTATRSPGRMRIKFFRMRPETCARTWCLFSSSTLNMALGNVSRTVAITSIASSFDNPYPDSACLPQASPQNLIASKTNGLLSQHNGTIGGHCYRVLKMRAQASVFRHRGPAITQYLHTGLARVHHRLDAEHHAFPQLHALATTAVIRHLRIFMQPRADAMPDKFPHDTKAVRFHDFLHGSADIAQIRSHLYGADAAFKRCLR